MYRILIADDEPLEREGMELIISTMLSQDVDIIQATNGKEAVQMAMIFKPHIILMDIRMPGLNGLHAIKEIKAVFPQMKVVLVTAYDYFDYAKEAIQLGVKDYLVKPANRKEIVSLLENLFAELDEEATEVNVLHHNQQKLLQYTKLAKTELALKLMSDQQHEGETLTQLAELVSFSFDNCFSIVLVLKTKLEHKKQLELAIHQAINKLFGRSLIENVSLIESPIVNEHMALFISTNDNDKITSLFNGINNFAEQFIAHMKQKLNIEIYIGVGTLQQQLNGVRRSYFEAVFASTNVNQEQSICMFEHIQQRIMQPLLLDNEHHATYVKQAIEKIRQERDHETHSVISRATSYIQKNYHRELSLEEVAEYVYLNPFYFSKVFKQLTGATFIDYVTEVRISQAKKLMEQKDLSLKEICYLVGYNDPNYLSRVFKKVVGKTPSEYRQSI